ncbi:thioredoxin domain-containing protein [Sphingomonas sp.]|uniref:thioredoxin domain-containing protein n=1 Tax=Sphingomonas sp. TaxID=28214 RepID=UPI003AFF7747
MRPSLILAIALPALALAGCNKKEEAGTTAASPVAAGPTVAAPSGGWEEQVAATPEGGIRMGNPDARGKLVEYASYTCPHCAAFDQEGLAEIRRYVGTGKLSYELRPFVRDPYDLTAALIARCGGPQPFFRLTDQIYAQQQEWIGNVQNMTPADQKRIQSLPQAQQFQALARAMGLNAFAGQRGIPKAKADQCLSDQAQQDRLVQIRNDAQTKYQIEGTPTFLMNGDVIGSYEWAGLKPKLVAAMGG